MGSSPDFQGLGDVVELRGHLEGVVLVVVLGEMLFLVLRLRWLVDPSSCLPSPVAPGVPGLTSGSPP